MRWAWAFLLMLTGTAQAQAPARPVAVVGDTMPVSLTGRAGDAARGKALLADRQKSLCVLCHAGPMPDPHLQGNLAPPLNGVGARFSTAQLRLRIVDMKRLVPGTIMPSYYLLPDESRQIAPIWKGKPILAADEIEDIVAYLATVKD